MGDIRLLKQVWMWVQSQKHGCGCSRIAAKEKTIFLADRVWPAVYQSGLSLGSFLLMMLVQWRDSVVKGSRSMVGLGPAALFLILWSCFLSLTSISCTLYVLLGLAVAGAVIRCLGYTHGHFLVGLFAILLMWMYGNLWVTGMLFIVGGYLVSLNHARFLILISAAYAVYFVYARVGGLGVFLSLNLSFLSHDLLNRLLQGYDYINERPQSNEPKESDPIVEEFFEDYDYSPPSNESENVTSCKASCKAPSASATVNIQMDASPSKVVKSDSTSLDEMKRIMDSSNHYEALGLSRIKSIDLLLLKKEYRKRAMLVHPDKNMGNPLASESFKKLQCAYEVLSDTKRQKNYDEQLSQEEACRVNQKASGSSQQNGVGYRSEESRRIQCTKCRHSHIWICTNRNKARARWCQDCSQYHPARDGDGWVENGCSVVVSSSRKVDIPRAFVCAESKIFDVSEWATCQGIVCRPNSHRPSFQVNMVGLDRSIPQRSNTSRFPWGFDAELTPDEDEFDLWLQQALASGFFSDTTPKRRKSWSPFKISHRGMRPWRKSP